MSMQSAAAAAMKDDSQLRQKVAELTALNIISETVTASLDLQETLTVITDHTIPVIFYEGMHILPFRQVFRTP